jgi:ribosomal protein S18 acetylase RimI-like enzyme
MTAIVRAGAERIDGVEPLWAAMVEHHGAIAPDLGPLRDREDSWRRRREFYEQALGEPGSFLLIAEEDGRAIGYAMVKRTRPSFTWQLDDAATVESLAVLPETRGQGVGGALLDRVRDELRADGCPIWGLGVVATNEAAIRLYRRHGLHVAFLEMLGRP